MRQFLLLVIVTSSSAMDSQAKFNVLSELYLAQCVEDHVAEILEDVTFEINPGSLMRVKNFYFSPADLCQMYPRKDGPEAIKKIFKENKFWNKPHNDCTVNQLFGLLGIMLGHNSKRVLEIYLTCYPYAVHARRYHNGKLEDTLLSRAVNLDDLVAINLLLQRGADPNDPMIKPDLLRSKIMECNAQTFWDVEPFCIALVKHGAHITTNHFSVIGSTPRLLNTKVLLARHRLLKKCYDLMVLNLRRTSTQQVPVNFLNLLPREILEQLAAFGFVAHIQYHFVSPEDRKTLHQCLLPQEPLPKQG